MVVAHTYHDGYCFGGVTRNRQAALACDQHALCDTVGKLVSRWSPTNQRRAAVGSIVWDYRVNSDQVPFRQGTVFVWSFYRLLSHRATPHWGLSVKLHLGIECK